MTCAHDRSAESIASTRPCVSTGVARCNNVSHGAMSQAVPAPQTATPQNAATTHVVPT